MNTLGWDEERALSIEASYHKLYKESDDYVQDRLREASQQGYVEVAFGFRVRTPLLHQVVWDSGRSMPYEASGEGRTAGNALGQSYGLLNNRAAVAFFKRVWDSPYRYDILPIALIHDAIYFICKDDVRVVEWANNALIEEMSWQELPELHHDTVKLSAMLDIFWPSWDVPITIPNNILPSEIRSICDAAVEAWL